MNIELQEIEIRDLLSIRGASGLWKIRRFVKKANIVNCINIVTEEVKSFPLGNVGAIKDYQVYTNDGEKRLTIESVFENIEKLKTEGEIYVSTEFKKLPENIKTEYMEKIAPNHSDMFKDYHVEKILKWAEELEKYFEIANENIEEL